MGGSDMTDHAQALDRRAFIQVTGLTTVGGLLAACGAPAPAPTATSASAARVSSPPTVGAPSSAGAAATNLEAGLNIGASTAAALPSYIPITPATPPDFDAHDPRVTVGYNRYPKNPPKSWTKEPPGTGGKVTAFVATYYPPPTPFVQNPTWHAVNQALNAAFQMDLVAGPDYPAKLATIIDR